MGPQRFRWRVRAVAPLCPGSGPEGGGCSAQQSIRTTFAEGSGESTRTYQDSWSYLWVECSTGNCVKSAQSAGFAGREPSTAREETRQNCCSVTAASCIVPSNKHFFALTPAEGETPSERMG